MDVQAIQSLKRIRAIFNEIQGGGTGFDALHLLMGDDGENSLASSLQGT
jgi:hypothetical protein